MSQVMKYVVVVAGGKGLRMGGDIPKQFLPVAGKPVLMRTLERFRQFDAEIRIFLVLPASHFSYWQQLCSDYHFHVPHHLVEGGETRFHSVKNGLTAVATDFGAGCVEDDALVAVHDGVRPFVSVETIERTYACAQRVGSAIPVVDSVDSLRYCEGEESRSVDRSRYKLVQTPQTFSLKRLLAAYDLPYRDTFTDDASVYESAGNTIALVEGNRENIKITTAYDMKVAQVLVNE